MHEMYTFLYKEIEKKYSKVIILENYKKILITVMPVIPHFSNECLENIGFSNNLSWPIYDEKFIEDKNALIVIQVNGKKRGLITLPKNTPENELLNKIIKDEKIFKYIEGKKIKKKIFIKDKLINVIV